MNLVDVYFLGVISGLLLYFFVDSYFNPTCYEP